MPIPARLLPVAAVRSSVIRTDWTFEVGADTEIAQVLDPEFWVNVARRFRVNDRLEIVHEKGLFDLDLRVVAIDPRGYWAQTRTLRRWPEGEGEVAEAEAEAEIPLVWPDKQGYRVEFNKMHQWRIISPSGEVIGKLFATEKDAAVQLERIKSEIAAARAAA